MKTLSQTSRCIGCSSEDAHMGSMGFMGQEAAFPICDSCATYLERVFTDPSLSRDFMTFIGFTDIQRPRQSGGAFSFVSPSDSVPPDFEDRLQDFDLYCEYIGKRIQTLRAL